MSNTNLSNQSYKECIALAGLLQAASLVDELANTGKLDEESFAVSIGSVFELDAPTIESVFAGEVNFIPGLALGFRRLRELLEHKRTPASDYFRYALGLLHLQKKLQGNRDLMDILGSRLTEAKDKLKHFNMTHERIIASLAHIYEDTLSTFRYRIQVTGNRLYLENPSNVHKIRALLLAGIRSAMLWRQVGGKRWHFLTQRRAMLAVTKSLV